jgi:hypothetical protein
MNLTKKIDKMSLEICCDLGKLISQVSEDINLEEDDFPTDKMDSITRLVNSYCRLHRMIVGEPMDDGRGDRDYMDDLNG